MNRHKPIYFQVPLAKVRAAQAEAEAALWWNRLYRTGLLVLLILAVVLLLSGCAAASVGSGAVASAPRGMWQACVMVALMCGSVWLVVLAVRKMRRDDAALWEERDRFEAEIRGGKYAAVKPRPDLRAGVPTSLPFDELALARRGIDAAELRRITGAMIVTACEVSDLVRKAQGNLSVEDYGASLAEAEERQKWIIACLSGLNGLAGWKRTREDAQ